MGDERIPRPIMGISTPLLSLIVGLAMLKVAFEKSGDDCEIRRRLYSRRSR